MNVVLFSPYVGEEWETAPSCHGEDDSHDQVEVVPPFSEAEELTKGHHLVVIFLFWLFLFDLKRFIFPDLALTVQHPLLNKIE